jgi:hypothetical protein
MTRLNRIGRDATQMRHSDCGGVAFGKQDAVCTVSGDDVLNLRVALNPSFVIFEIL